MNRQAMTASEGFFCSSVLSLVLALVLVLITRGSPPGAAGA
ncbi:hypothetical protein [Aminomonas paucivorans]